MEPNHNMAPAGKATDLFEDVPHAKYSDMLENLAYQRDMAKKRNLAYLALVGICVIACVTIATTFNYKTYVVRVDNATGRVETGGQLTSTNYVPKEAEIRYFLSEFIQNTRTVPLDPVRMRQQWERATHFMTSEATNKMSDFMRKDNPTAKLGKMTVQPTITSLQLYPNTNNTYQIRWYEEEYSINGNATSKKRNYIGLFMVTVEPPTAEGELMINPLGIRIKDLSISEETVGR